MKIQKTQRSIDTYFSIILFLGFFISLVAGASLTSPFPSSVPGIDIANTHILVEDDKGKALVLRGMEPRTAEDIKQLKDFEDNGEQGVKEALIFKKYYKTTKVTEEERLNEQVQKYISGGFESSSVYYIPFLWKDFPDFRTPCRNTVKAFQILKRAMKNKHLIFMHCTVGEDRTGYLAGLFTLLLNRKDNKEEGLDLKTIFQEEMCQRGYGRGNPNKPPYVVGQIREDLTPLFLKMAYKIQKSYLTWDSLRLSQCEKDPGVHYPIEEYQCEKQPIP